MNLNNVNSSVERTSTDSVNTKNSSIGATGVSASLFAEIFNNINFKNTNIESSKGSHGGRELDINNIVMIDLNDNSIETLGSLFAQIQNILESSAEAKYELLNIINDSVSLEELEEKMAILASELSLNTNILLNINSSSKDEIGSLSMVSTNEESIAENISSTNINSLNTDILESNTSEDLINSFIETLENSVGNDDVLNISSIIKKLQNLLKPNISKEDNMANKKKEVELTFDNLNVNMIHAQVMKSNSNLSASVEKNNFNSNPIINNIANIVNEKISNSSLNNETLKVRLKLYPSNLGSLVIDIIHQDGKVNLKVLTENANVKYFLADSIKDIVSSLRENNIQVGDVMVGLNNESQSSFASGSQSNSQSSNNSNNNNNRYLYENIETNTVNIEKTKEISNSNKLDIHI